MAKKRKIPKETPEEIARWEETRRKVDERIAFHQEMSELLGEREREQALLERLREQRRRAAG